MTAIETNLLVKKSRRTRLGSRSTKKIQPAEVRTDPFKGKPLARIFHNLEIPELKTVTECDQEQEKYKRDYCRSRAEHAHNDKVPLLLKDRLAGASFIFLFIETFLLLICGAFLNMTIFAWASLAAIAIAWIIPLWLNRLNNKMRRDRQQEAFEGFMVLTHWQNTSLRGFKGRVPEEAIKKAAMIEGEAEGKVSIEVRHFYEDPYILARHIESNEVKYFHQW